MNEENKKIDPQLDADQDIDWDNGDATYGHKRTDFKRKDQPDEEHLAKNEDVGHNIKNDLKNTNLSLNEDIANRNKESDKGISGKDL